eukprot:6497475-Karenia_brevis.AAC.1
MMEGKCKKQQVWVKGQQNEAVRKISRKREMQRQIPLVDLQNTYWSGQWCHEQQDEYKKMKQQTI